MGYRLCNTRRRMRTWQKKKGRRRDSSIQTTSSSSSSTSSSFSSASSSSSSFAFFSVPYAPYRRNLTTLARSSFFLSAQPAALFPSVLYVTPPVFLRLSRCSYRHAKLIARYRVKFEVLGLSSVLPSRNKQAFAPAFSKRSFPGCRFLASLS